MKKSIVAAVLFLIVGISSFAQEQNFTLVNGCDFVISYVYISPASSEDWGEDVLTVDVLGSGEECDIYFEGYDDCRWDIKAVADDGSSAIWTGIDLCEYFVITLTMTDDGPYALME
jgi:hypothetical protein